ncbi:hypothetical protein AB0B78_36590, partial [Streptomyces sp. NPDC040724]|uniref:hypothetical protein n=1 Tax=Streptomyces sp. NPDC040724 TaxID=3155612 RepID=UPI0033D1EB6B
SKAEYSHTHERPNHHTGYARPGHLNKILLRALSGGDPPYRIWDIGPDGEWRTPAAVTLDARSEVTMPASLPGFMLVQGAGLRDAATTQPKYTFLLDRDTDALYERLCSRYPLSVEKDQWRALFPHLPHQRSCG